MNSIANTQYQPIQISRLAAKRQLYSESKGIFILQISLALLGVILGFLSVNVWPIIKIFSAYYGVVVTAVDFFYLTPRLNDKRTLASKVQELFDCDVLGLDWPSMIAGHPPEKEIIVEKRRAYDTVAHRHGPLTDWYPVSAGALPLYLARLVCQRSNLWWDANLRRRYAEAITVILVVSFVLLAGGLFFTKVSASTILLSIIVPFAPAFYLGVRQIRENREAVARLERLREFAEKLWNSALNKQKDEHDVSLESRRLQDAIYLHRSRTPLIFDWIQNRFRNAMDSTMNIASDELVNEAKTRLP